MAQSKYEYVKKFEQSDNLLLGCFIVIRIDGRSFSRFTKENEYLKPNDKRGIDLMNYAATSVMKEFPDIFMAYGQSDEYSFVLKPSSRLYQRRASKLISTITSLFTAHFIIGWSQYFDVSMKLIPTFDGRAVCYPTSDILKDYLAWRQVDCHINNLYNTCFWKLVQSGKTQQEANQLLKDTNSSDKNELLFSQFKTNYNNIDEMYKKGSVLTKNKIEHVDIIQNEAFWRRVDFK